MSLRQLNKTRIYKTYNQKYTTMDQELLNQVSAKANEWLSPAYDAATQAEVKAMLEKEDKTELIDSLLYMYIVSLYLKSTTAKVMISFVL